MKRSDIQLDQLEPATMTSEEIRALCWPVLETDDNRNCFSEMVTVMQGVIFPKN